MSLSLSCPIFTSTISRTGPTCTRSIGTYVCIFQTMTCFALIEEGQVGWSFSKRDNPSRSSSSFLTGEASSSRSPILSPFYPRIFRRVLVTFRAMGPVHNAFRSFFLMLSPRQLYEVFWFAAGRVIAYMMYLFARFQRTCEMLVHKTMYQFS